VLGPSTAAITAAADARGIPVRRLTKAAWSSLARAPSQRRIWTAETDRTSAVAESIAQDKELTKNLLRAGGIPFRGAPGQRTRTMPGKRPRRSARPW